MKAKPVFKNVTRARIQIMRRGVPVWLEPGDTITGESYRVYLPMGLKEVGREPKAAPATVNDPAPEASPVTIRASVDEEKKAVSLELLDDVIPTDSLHIGGETLKQSIIAELETDLPADLTEDDIFIIADDEDMPEPVVDNYPHKCDAEGCEKAFASKRGLKSHKRIHR